MRQAEQQVRREKHHIVLYRLRSTQKHHSLRGETPEINGVAAICASEHHRRLISAALLNREVQRSRLGPPPRQIASTITARPASMFAEGQIDAATRAHQFFGDLRTGGPPADNQHGAVRKLVGVAVAAGMHLEYAALSRQ